MDLDFFLIQKMKRGDKAAFDVFVRKYYTEILRYCNYHCHDSFYAEDLTQETFIRFFTKLSDYRYIGKTKNYQISMRIFYWFHKLASSVKWYHFTHFRNFLYESISQICLLGQHPQSPSSRIGRCLLLVPPERLHEKSPPFCDRTTEI